jgi:hypothetical protein
MNFKKIILERDDELQKKSYWNGNGKTTFTGIILIEKRED